MADLFFILSKSDELKKAQDSLSEFLGHFVMFLVDAKRAKNPRTLEAELNKNIKETEESKPSSVKIISEAIRHVAKSRKFELFQLSPSNNGFCYALEDAGKIKGLIIAYGLRHEPPLVIVSMFTFLIETVISGIKKEITLEGLNNMLRLKALALSTVHTIHRLITSSLNVNELLSRIARLSMQILKTNRCSIKLVDSKKKTLLPMTTVDLRTAKAKLKKVKIGRWAPGKAVKYGRSVRGDAYLATPLIDEDILGVITLYDKINHEPFNSFDEEIMRTLAEQAAIAIKNAQLYREQEKLTLSSIKALAQIIESKGAGITTPKSSFLKVAQLVGQRFGLDESELKRLQYASLLHDAGELLVPDSVLRKRGKLTDREYRMIKEHPFKGAKIIKSFKALKAIAPIIMYHHENFDGTGYPKGLKGAEIPLSARIMAVVSAFEAMITKKA